jgi:SAM-dependent methyltransferase
MAHWDEVAHTADPSPRWSAYYHRRLADIYCFLTPPDPRILELGCGEADLLAALEPSVGVGVDFSEEMLAKAHERHPELRLIQSDVHDLELDETFRRHHSIRPRKRPVGHPHGIRAHRAALHSTDAHHPELLQPRLAAPARVGQPPRHVAADAGSELGYA